MAELRGEALHVQLRAAARRASTAPRVPALGIAPEAPNAPSHASPRAFTPPPSASAPRSRFGVTAASSRRRSRARGRNLLRRSSLHAQATRRSSRDRRASRQLLAEMSRASSALRTAAAAKTIRGNAASIREQVDAIKSAIQSRSKNFSVNSSSTPPLGTRRRRNSILFSHREPRARGNVAGARAPGEVARHLSQVLGQPLRVCVKLEAVAAAAVAQLLADRRRGFARTSSNRIRLCGRCWSDSAARSPKSSAGARNNHGSQSAATNAVPVPAGAGKSAETGETPCTWKLPRAAAWSWSR